MYFTSTYIHYILHIMPFWLFEIILADKSDSYLSNKANLEAESDPSLQGIDHWAYSPIHLKLLSNLEQNLFLELATAEINAEYSEQQSQTLQWWFQNFGETYFEENIDPKPIDQSEWATRIASHPFLTYRMIKRFSRLNDVLNLNSNSSIIPDALKESIQMDFVMPNETDVENIMQSILELQFMYDLRTDELFAGRFYDVETKIGLNLAEAYAFGSFAYKARKFPEALDWLETVYTEMENNSDSTMLVSREAVFSLILNLSREHDELIDAISTSNHFFADHFHRFTRKINSPHRLVTMKEFSVSDFKKTQDRNSFPAYSLLCAGEDFRSETERSQLYCWLDRKSDLAWTINPLKVEIHSHDPYVVQLHHLLGEKVIEGLTQAVSSEMEQRYSRMYVESDAVSGVVNVSMLRSAVINERVEELGKLVQPLDKKIERVTQLAASNVGDPYFLASEQFKITSYAFGGQFFPHLDAYGSGRPDEPENNGDRVATLTIYLNDVPRGGYTVFPKLGIHVIPQRGSALFWYDLMRNGTPDQRVLHGACPVILGQKWIATKWIRQNANFRKRPCSLDETE